MNKILLVVLVVLALVFGGCSTKKKRVYNAQSKSSKKYGDPKMRPYTVLGVRYYPAFVSSGTILRGRASWYGSKFHGNNTANGEIYSMHGMTAAHKTLPMNTLLKVTNLNNGRSVVVRINDRGPFKGGRIIDLSKSAAKKIDMIGTGTAPVTLEILDSQKKALKDRVNTKYVLQIGSFSNIDGALKMQEKYDNFDGYSSVIKDMNSKGGRVFKVWLKGFESEKEARDYKAKRHFNSAFIVRED